MASDALALARCLLATWTVFLLVGAGGVEETMARCGEIFCENNSNCRVTQTRVGNHVIADTECVCATGWTGQFCEIRLELSVGEVMSRSAKVTVRSNAEMNMNTKADGFSSLTKLAYKLQYWPIDRGERVSCEIVPDITLSEYVLEGLHPDKHYVVCACAPDQDMCYDNVFVAYSRNRNCAIVKTEATSGRSEQLSLMTALVSVFCLIILIVLVAFVRFVLRRRTDTKNTRQTNCLHSICNELCKERRCTLHRSKRRITLRSRNVETDYRFIDDEDVISRLTQTKRFTAFVERNCSDLTTFRPDQIYESSSDPSSFSGSSGVVCEDAPMLYVASDYT